ncbi:hypothetical protein RHSIM_Rhsim04G0019300 [Rhododendron simsii]|uniref:Epidermal patterning factor-like protein n=1 Tax=Rhododendron simsii TaxID=118357 RepID=A0A834LS20_RHOSS|nr:hypothetical protein RHSIM_Rhsim04G0019300 [Rhododendron simsii]
MIQSITSLSLSLSLSLSAMKGFIRILVLLSFLLLVPDVMLARNIAQSHPREGDYVDFSLPALVPAGLDTSNSAVERDLHAKRRPVRKRRGHHETVQIAGSRLPDCAHACGSCSPCRLVMVSFKCSLLAEAETCPMAYKCICNTKSFPVP